MGKTTLLKHVLGDEYAYVTLDDINDLELAKTDPKLFFVNYPGRLLIDEVQNAPELLMEIKRIVDATDDRGTIILTGSQTFSLMANVSESLAGRVGILELNGLSLRELKSDTFHRPFIPDDSYLESRRVKMDVGTLWEFIHRGAMPELHRNQDLDWELFYASYVKTYLERDVRSIVNVRDLDVFSRFIRALAARTGQLLNDHAIGSEIGINEMTVKSWIGILEASGVVVRIPVFSNNRLSRAIKTPVLYFMDTGLVSYLLRWPTAETLMRGAMSGPILETFAVSEVLKSFNNVGVTKAPIYYYRDKDGREIDLIIEEEGTLYPVEIKQSATPRLEMARHFKLLERAVGYKVGNKVILSLVDKKRYLAEDVVAYPVTAI